MLAGLVSPCDSREQVDVMAERGHVLEPSALSAALSGDERVGRFVPAIQVKRTLGCSTLGRNPYPEQVLGFEATARFLGADGKLYGAGSIFRGLEGYTQLIADIDLCMLRFALRLRAELAQVNSDVHSSSNVSPELFHLGDFEARVRGILEEESFEPDTHNLELLESLRVNPEGEVQADRLQVLRELSALGLSFAFDDLGSPTSVRFAQVLLARSVPVTVLKVGRREDWNLHEAAVGDRVHTTLLQMLRFARQRDVEVSSVVFEGHPHMNRVRLEAMRQLSRSLEAEFPNVTWCFQGALPTLAH